MRLRTVANSIATAIMLTGAAAAAHAQISLPSPSVARPLLNHVVAPPANPGTGTFATSIVPAAHQNTRSLGNATSISFADPTAGSGQSGLTVQHAASTVQIQYPANDQLAASLAQLPCAMSGCVIPDFKIQTQVGSNMMMWDIQNAVITQLQMSPAVSVSLKYEKMMLTTTAISSNSNGSTTGPTKATYNIGAKQSS